jgi:CubicO group peptidase (beta-lactamase class C family)
VTEIEAYATPTGLPDLGRGLFLRARDIARFGQLILDDGVRDGERLVPEGWIAATTRAYTEIGWERPDDWDFQLPGYGYQWWLGYFDLDDRRLRTFAARGHGEQLTAVIPELALVVSVNASVYDVGRHDQNQVFRLVREYLLPAFLEQATAVC